MCFFLLFYFENANSSEGLWSSGGFCKLSKAKLRIDWAALSWLVIRQLVESDLSGCQSGVILRELISLAFCLGGPVLNERELFCPLSLSFKTFHSRFSLVMFQPLSKHYFCILWFQSQPLRVCIWATFKKKKERLFWLKLPHWKTFALISFILKQTSKQVPNFRAKRWRAPSVSPSQLACLTDICISIAAELHETGEPSSEDSR